MTWLRGTLAVRPFIVNRHGEQMLTLPNPWPFAAFGLVEGVMRYWWRDRWPVYASQFVVLEAERARRWRIAADVFLEVQPDVLLLHKQTMAMYPLDLKFTTRIDDSWLRQWPAHPQVIAYSASLDWGDRGRLGGMIIEGIDRGDMRQGIFTSSLASGYVAGKSVATDISQMARVRTSNSQKRAPVPLHQIREWVDTAPSFLFAHRVIVPPPSADLIDAYADLVSRHVRTVNTRLEQSEAAARWPMNGIVNGECAAPQHTCPYASMCFPGAFPPQLMQPRDPHHNPYQPEDDE